MHYENIKEECVALPNGESTTFAAYFAGAPLFRSQGLQRPRQAATFLRVAELLDPTVELQ